MLKVTLPGKAAIAFLARDCEKTLPVFLVKTESLRSHFSGSEIYIVENGSKDSTRELLEGYRSSHHGVMLYTFDDPDFDGLPRIEKMARLRNRNLDMVRESGYTPDYYIVIDSDLDFDPAGVIRSIKRAPEGWGALFANGCYYLKARAVRIPVIYYDLFAYLPADGKEDSLTETEMHGMRKDTHKALKKNGYLKCRSAFGGVGVYRYDAIGNSRYAAEDNTRSSDFKHICEHIPFNREVSKNGALYVCRDMKVYYERISFKNWLSEWARDNNSEDKLNKVINFYRKLMPFRKGNRR